MSALRALVALGLDEVVAGAFLAQAKNASAEEISLEILAGAPAEAGQALLLRRMRGGHMQVFRLQDEVGQ